MNRNTFKLLLRCWNFSMNYGSFMVNWMEQRKSMYIRNTFPHGGKTNFRHFFFQASTYWSVREQMAPKISEHRLEFEWCCSKYARNYRFFVYILSFNRMYIIYIEQSESSQWWNGTHRTVQNTPYRVCNGFESTSRPLWILGIYEIYECFIW